MGRPAWAPSLIAPQTAFSTSLISVVVLLREMLKKVASPDSSFPPLLIAELREWIGTSPADEVGPNVALAPPPESRCTRWFLVRQKARAPMSAIASMVKGMPIARGFVFGAALRLTGGAVILGRADEVTVGRAILDAFVVMLGAVAEDGRLVRPHTSGLRLDSRLRLKAGEE